MTEDEYQCLAVMPDEVQYVCTSCHDEENPEWLDSVRQEIQAGYVYVCYGAFFLFIHALDICPLWKFGEGGEFPRNLEGPSDPGL